METIATIDFLLDLAFFRFPIISYSNSIAAFSLWTILSELGFLTERVALLKFSRLIFPISSPLNAFPYFFRLSIALLRNSIIFLLEIFSAGRPRISSQVISGIDLTLLEFRFVVMFPDLRLMLCNSYPINN